MTGTKGNLALAGVRRSSLAAGGSTAATLESLNLGLNATSVGGGANRRQDGPNGVDKTELAVGSRILEGGLNDIVRVRVAEQALNLTRSKELLDDHVTRGLLGAAQALLNDVGAELVARQLTDAVLEHADNRLSEGRLVEVDDVLDHIVPKGILNQNRGVFGDLRDEPDLLVARGMVNAALEDTAAVTVSTDVNAVGTDSIEDELRVLGTELVKTLLNDVVAVEVLNKLDNLVAQGIDDHLDLGGGGDEFNHLLQGASAVLVESNADHVGSGILDQDGALVVIAVLQELLAEVVAKGVGHELNDVLVGLKPDHMDLLRVALLELLLQIAAAVLVLAEIVNLTAHVLEREAVVA